MLGAPIAAQVQVRGDSVFIIEPGVIKVAKSPVYPYVKIDYDYRMVTAKKKERYSKKVYSSALEGMVDIGFLKKDSAQKDPSNNLSRLVCDSISFLYSYRDTPQVDTVRFHFTIKKNGLIKSIITVERGTHNKYLFRQASALMNKYNYWPAAYRAWEPGGSVRKNRFSSTPKFYPAEFDCTFTLVVASFPLTLKQKNTGIHFIDNDEFKMLGKKPAPRIASRNGGGDR